MAAIAGDVRKALDVCRRAVELCETQACRQAVLKPSNGMMALFCDCSIVVPIDIVVLNVSNEYWKGLCQWLVFSVFNKYFFPTGSPRKAANKAVNNVVPCMVEIPSILHIFNDVYGSRVVSAVIGAPESFPLQQKMLLCCLLLIFKYARSKDITLGKVCWQPLIQLNTKACRVKLI